MEFKDELKQARAATGLSQVKTAAALGVPYRTYQDWEAGKREPAGYTQEDVLGKLYDLANAGTNASAKNSKYLVAWDVVIDNQLGFKEFVGRKGQIVQADSVRGAIHKVAELQNLEPKQCGVMAVGDKNIKTALEYYKDVNNFLIK